MNELWQGLLNRDICCFKHLVDNRLEIDDKRRRGFQRVYLLNVRQINPCFFHDVFDGVVVIGFVTGYQKIFGQVKIVLAQSTGVIHCT